MCCSDVGTGCFNYFRPGCCLNCWSCCLSDYCCCSGPDSLGSVGTRSKSGGLTCECDNKPDLGFDCCGSCCLDCGFICGCFDCFLGGFLCYLDDCCESCPCLQANLSSDDAPPPLAPHRLESFRSDQAHKFLFPPLSKHHNVRHDATWGITTATLDEKNVKKARFLQSPSTRPETTHGSSRPREKGCLVLAQRQGKCTHDANYKREPPHRLVLSTHVRGGRKLYGSAVVVDHSRFSCAER